ncbi:nucleotide cyclase [Aspergillus caelatus]|uniref:Nucleotide cyclase n=1 Tax=Aspergillus caelatus TaxID=61420 RepID=A0A5N6ZUZ4_9EURO|nr:nucleotide cyclase [Aspergillus caelatus]KAE8361342.1 nucleotide cyclase [Aspergillus caelatus]
MKDLYKMAIDEATIFSETDSNGTILNVNDLFCAASGYTRLELVGQNHRLVNSQQHNPAFYRGIWASVANGSLEDGRYQDVYDGPLHILRYVSVSFDITESIQAIAALQSQASYDSLTGLPNRASLLKHIEDILSSARRHHCRRFAVDMLDMNKFKQINDMYGHCEDMVARLGGDEFVIVFDDASMTPNRSSAPINVDRVPNGTEPLSAILDRAFSESFPLGDGIFLDTVNASLGIAVYPEHGSDSGTLLRNADRAMYQAKRKGQACVHVFDWDIRSNVSG